MPGKTDTTLPGRKGPEVDPEEPGAKGGKTEPRKESDTCCLGKNLVPNGDFEQPGGNFHSGYQQAGSLNQLHPGTFIVNVNGKHGTVTKSLLVQGSQATWTLLVTAELPPPADVDPVSGVSRGVAMSARSRGKNIGLAKADRQAVFKGDCAGCHSHYAENQFGQDLYLGACAICHDAEHRASMVPDLRAAGVPGDAAYWREYITEGIDETLMPTFAKEKGGILSNEQIESLVTFLVETPLKPTALR